MFPLDGDKDFPSRVERRSNKGQSVNKCSETYR